ncbi:hypothetical protein FE848_10325 [Marinobacter sp. 1-3A]|uniref:DUF6708 domain-containing protein n=1 Tax=Marinobacter sp. 1-3A TaxID=2582920 RepID=UPI00190880DC|nr:DUF6708 domain-containing protein [Marinobacter sp. 1-3A]MBK1873620.1 hypothetical protein [Marinobacter sp. 1-3A]
MIDSAKKLLDAVTDKLGDPSKTRLLKGGFNSGSYPSLPGLLETQNEVFLSLRTASSDSKGMLTGMGFFLGSIFMLTFLLLLLSGDVSTSRWWILFMAVVSITAPIIWETRRPAMLPIIFNRRTQEIYYDLKGQLYHAIWDDIEAVAYEYMMVNPNSGAIPHGSLEIILQKFGEPKTRIALNLSGMPAGKRLPTLVSMWEYLRRYMINGPWFDEAGRQTAKKSEFVEKTLKAGQESFLDQVRSERLYLAHERQEGNGISGTAVFLWLGSFVLLPMAYGMECIQRIDRRKSRSEWPDVVRQRLERDGPRTRLTDIEESYLAQKEKEEQQKQRDLEELHERMRRVLPK